MVIYWLINKHKNLSKKVYIVENKMQSISNLGDLLSNLYSLEPPTHFFFFK